MAREFIKPISLVGKEWAQGKDVLETDFFKKSKNLLATYSEGEFKTLNALFYIIQNEEYLLYDEDEDTYLQTKAEAYLTSKWVVIKEADLRNLTNTKDRHTIEITDLVQDKIKLKLDTEKITVIDAYLYGLMTKTIVATNVYDHKLRAKIQLMMYSIISDVKKIRQGNESVYHIKIGEALKLATRDYRVALTSNTTEYKAVGNYIKQTTDRKSLGKYAELLIEFLKIHEWKETYTASLPELRKALNLPEYEKTKRVTLSRIIDKISRNQDKIIKQIQFKYEVHKPDEKITFYFVKRSLFD
ncbi:MAG: hypothetical protein RBS24_06105 [Bacilli bacterium]|nr:hypothetical protein [Bacilli bacterium]